MKGNSTSVTFFEDISFKQCIQYIDDIGRGLYIFIFLEKFDNGCLLFQDVFWPNGTKLKTLKRKVAMEFGLNKFLKFFFANDQGQIINTNIK